MVVPRALTPLDPAFLSAAFTPLVPIRVLPPLPSLFHGHHLLGLVAPYRASIIVGRSVGDPAPQARATGQVIAAARRGTEIFTVFYFISNLILMFGFKSRHSIYSSNTFYNKRNFGTLTISYYGNVSL